MSRGVGLTLEDKRSTFLRNVRIHSPYDTALYPRDPDSSVRRVGCGVFSVTTINTGLWPPPSSGICPCDCQLCLLKDEWQACSNAHGTEDDLKESIKGIAPSVSPA